MITVFELKTLKKRKRQLERILKELYQSGNEHLTPKYEQCLRNTNKKIHDVRVALCN